MCDLELGAVHLGGPDRHDLGAGFGVEYNALDVRSLDRLELGRLVMGCRLVVIARRCLAAAGGKRYYAGNQDKTRAGGP
jgi:hypothetical protein